jgi:hypothetical protein
MLSNGFDREGHRSILNSKVPSSYAIPIAVSSILMRSPVIIHPLKAVPRSMYGPRMVSWELETSSQYRGDGHGLFFEHLENSLYILTNDHWAAMSSAQNFPARPFGSDAGADFERGPFGQALCISAV